MEARPVADMGVSVRSINPHSGSSVSILSKMYSMLNGFELFLFVALRFFLRREASLHSNVNSAMESTKC